MEAWSALQWYIALQGVCEIRTTWDFTAALNIPPHCSGDTKTSQRITTWLLLPDPSAGGSLPNTWRCWTDNVWIMSDATNSRILISGDAPGACSENNLENEKRIACTYLYQVVLWLILVGDTEMVFLVPVTLPSGAQAAHTSVTDGHTHIQGKVLRNMDNIELNQACFLALICSHEANSPFFWKYAMHWFIFSVP